MSEQATTNQPVQGWYADPNDSEQLRWWDGSAWTDHVHAADAAPEAADSNGSSDSSDSIGVGAGQSGGLAAATTAAGPSVHDAGAGGSGVSEWLSVRSNQVLLAVLIVAIALFAFVMLGAGT